MSRRSISKEAFDLLNFIYNMGILESIFITDNDKQFTYSIKTGTTLGTRVQFFTIEKIILEKADDS